MTQNPDDPHSGMHFCIRCETWQKRGVIHFCEATPRYLPAKLAGKIVYDEPEFIPVGGPKSVHLSTENAPKHGENTQKVDKTAAKVDKSATKVDKQPLSPPPVHSDVPAKDGVVVQSKEDRRAYEREYKCKKRAGAKANKKESAK